jgi:hypothetical protein
MRPFTARTRTGSRRPPCRPPTRAAPPAGLCPRARQRRSGPRARPTVARPAWRGLPRAVIGKPGVVVRRPPDEEHPGPPHPGEVPPRTRGQINAQGWSRRPAARAQAQPPEIASRANRARGLERCEVDLSASDLSCADKSISPPGHVVSTLDGGGNPPESLETRRPPGRCNASFLICPRLRRVRSPGGVHRVEPVTGHRAARCPRLQPKTSCNRSRPARAFPGGSVPLSRGHRGQKRSRLAQATRNRRCPAARDRRRLVGAPASGLRRSDPCPRLPWPPLPGLAATPPRCGVPEGMPPHARRLMAARSAPAPALR